SPGGTPRRGAKTRFTITEAKKHLAASISRRRRPSTLLTSCRSTRASTGFLAISWAAIRPMQPGAFRWASSGRRLLSRAVTVLARTATTTHFLAFQLADRLMVILVHQ